MALHPLAERFASVVDVYERGRPEYAPGVAGALAGELRLTAGSPVLDLAAGTGKLSRALLAAGLDVVAVEPLAALRDVLDRSIGAERVRDGFAEAIPLTDASVDAVTVADAFHWFDRSAALGEIRRVLRPGGGLAIISVAPDWGNVSWAHELGTLVSGLRPEHPHFDGPPWQDAVRAAGGWDTPRELRVTVSQPFRPEQVVDHLASISWVAALPEAERLRTIEMFRELIASEQAPAEMRVHFVIGLSSLLS